MALLCCQYEATNPIHLNMLHIKKHKSVSKELKNIGYDGYITAEVLNHNNEIMHKYLDKTVKIMRELYV